jgi:hypothetical protein
MSKAEEYRKEFKEAWDKYKEICKRFEHDPEHPMTSRTMVMVIIEEAAQENEWFRDELVKWKSLAKRLVDESIKQDATNKRLKLKRKLDFNSFKSIVLIYRPLFNESELKNEWRDYCKKHLKNKP